MRLRIGEPPVNQSYLVIETIIDIAKKEKVDGIHPGYGLLSENADFARTGNRRRIYFYRSKSAEIIEMMGDKVKARNDDEGMLLFL